MPFAYLILGPPHAGQFEISQDLAESGFAENETVKLMPLAAAKDGLPEADTYLFLSNPWSSPADEVETFEEVVNAASLQVGRIIFVANTELLFKEPELDPWFEAAIHFSDFVLLNRREIVPNKWVDSYIERYEKACYPCPFERVKKNRVRNPALVLDPTPRRLSHLFDEIDPVDAMDWDEDQLPDEPVDLVRPPDPYLQRRPDGGRAIALPEMAEFVPKGEESD